MPEPSDGSVLDATLESERFDHLSIALHWIAVLLIIAMFATAWSREAVEHDTRLASALMTAHRTTGAVTWMVEWVRLAWRCNFAYLTPFPESMPKLQQWVAKALECPATNALVTNPFRVRSTMSSSGQIDPGTDIYSERNPVRGRASRTTRLVPLIASRIGGVLMHAEAPGKPTVLGKKLAQDTADGCRRDPDFGGDLLARRLDSGARGLRGIWLGNEWGREERSRKQVPFEILKEHDFLEIQGRRLSKLSFLHRERRSR